MKRTMCNSSECDSNHSHKKPKHSDTTKRDNLIKDDADTSILNYCPNQSLAKHIKSHKGVGLPEDDVKAFATDLLLGLKYIHGKKMIHCNIKPKNILLTPESIKRIRSNGFVAKITGFQNAIETESDEYDEGWGLMRGTTRFMSPELIRDDFLDYGADVWAFGCTVLEMLTGERVWSEHTCELVWEDWIDLIGESDTVPYLPGSVSKEAKDFIYKCLEKDPDQRLSVDGLLEHPFLTWKYDEEEEEEEIYEEEEEEEEYEGIAGVYVDVYEYGPYLDEEEEEEEEVEEEQEEIEIDDEYPREDSEEEEDL